MQLISIRRSRLTVLLPVSVALLIVTAFCRPAMATVILGHYHALYVPSHKITRRTLDEIVHYAALTPVNAVVLHVKTAKGRLMWPSENPTAIALGAGSEHSRLAMHVARLKRDHIRSIAKLDVFADDRLATAMPELSVMDCRTGAPWTDANGLHWVNPADSRVWAYNIALAKELARMGFDEIQFDYVRFPSDGDLSVIRYPNTWPGFSKSDFIEGFLENAYSALKPLGVCVSADVFGLTAWKTDDFGIGQVLEKMAPHLDVICPMFYPSHFPSGFLGKKSPGAFPELIMETSMRSMLKRTNKPVRPWVQGFWYGPKQIVAQIDGIDKASGDSWSIWNPAGHYALSYQAMAERAGITLSRPKFYPTVTDLASRKAHATLGDRGVVNYTSFKQGYSILSLEAADRGSRSPYSSPGAVLSTLEEGIMDHMLKTRGIAFKADAEPYTKRQLLSDMLSRDLGISARRMRPEPIYVDWAGDCIFTTKGIPQPRLAMYAQADRQALVKNTVRVGSSGPIDVAALAKNLIASGRRSPSEHGATILSR
jgi:hypothetical protein